MNTFKEFITSYDIEELQAIAEHGCASAAPGGMIYYSETTDLYNQHCNELHEVIGEWVDEIGFIPEYIAENIGDASTFKNGIVWAVAEYYANDILNDLESNNEKE
jgi:hypothetical protein